MTQIERAPFKASHAEGFSINALVVLSDQLPFGSFGDDLAAYYRAHVGAFVMVAKNYGSFGHAMINEFVAEIAGLPVSHAEAGNPNKTT